MPDLDPTETSELEALLNSTEPATVLNAILGSTPSGALIARAPDGKILHVSDFAVRLHGRPNSDFLGYTLADNFGPQRVFDATGRPLSGAERPLGRALRGETVTGFELTVEGPDGDRIPLVSNAAPIRNSHGKLIGAISSDADLRPYKALERSLRESEQQFRDLANFISQFVWMTDATGAAYWFNRRWYEYTGMTPEAPMGWGWLEAVHPGHVERVVERAQHTLSTGAPYEDTFPLRAADGRYRWFLARALAVRDCEGRVTRWFGTTTDVHAQLEAQELLRTMLEEVSHRVKNSLSLVSSVLKLQSRTVDDGARRALEEAALRVHAVARVHDQLWRGAGTHEIDLKPFLCDLCKAAATSSPRHRSSCDAEPALVSADVAVPLGLIVNELLTNAYKYAYPEGEGGEVHLTGAREPDGRYRIEVMDRGRGLPAGFDPAQARESLGMRVVTTLAVQLGAELAAGSAQPGARFTLVLPPEPAA